MKKPKSSKKSKSNYLKQPDIQRTPSMRDSVHIDSAITRFPAPPSTPEKTDILKRLSSLKPRSAGYNPDRLEELRELILTNKKICDVVIEEPETTSKSRLPRVEQRNGWFSQALFLSRSKHPSSRRKRLGNYRHIVIDQLYDGEHNASTYKVNGTRGLENTFFGEDQKKQISLAMDVEKTVEGESNEPAAKRTNPNQDVAPQCGIDQKTDVLQTSLMNGYTNPTSRSIESR